MGESQEGAELPGGAEVPRRADGITDEARDRRAELAGVASAEAAIVTAAGQDTPLAVPTDLTAAAFFDVDNTMMVGASIFHFARGLAARGKTGVTIHIRPTRRTQL